MEADMSGRNNAPRGLTAAAGGWLLHDAAASPTLTGQDWALRTLVLMLAICLIVLAMVNTKDSV
jgi:hypothetical protein